MEQITRKIVGFRYRTFRESGNFSSIKPLPGIRQGGLSDHVHELLRTGQGYRDPGTALQRAGSRMGSTRPVAKRERRQTGLLFTEEAGHYGDNPGNQSARGR